MNTCVQKEILKAHLRYYADVIPTREPAYGNFKRRVIIPKIYRALIKIEEGTYGICDCCGDKIPEERILLIPGALMCFECQQSKEK
jgi:formylmethanofuran dehydrogenase subunit E